MFEYGSMTDEQLNERLTTVNEKLVWAHNSGSSGIMNSLLQIAQAIESEIQFRAAKKLSQAIVDATENIETDPYLASKQSNKEEKNTIPNEETRRSKRRSLRPTTDKDI